MPRICSKSVFACLSPAILFTEAQPNIDRGVLGLPGKTDLMVEGLEAKFAWRGLLGFRKGRRDVIVDILRIIYINFRLIGAVKLPTLLNRTGKSALRGKSQFLEGNFWNMMFMVHRWRCGFRLCFFGNSDIEIYLRAFLFPKLCRVSHVLLTNRTDYTDDQNLCLFFPFRIYCRF